MSASYLPARVVGPVMARVRGHFERTGADAQAAVAETLDSQRYFDLLDRLDLLTRQQPPCTGLAARTAGDVLPAAVRLAVPTTTSAG